MMSILKDHEVINAEVKKRRKTKEYGIYEGFNKTIVLVLLI